MKRTLALALLLVAIPCTGCLTRRAELKSDHPPPNRYYLRDAYYRGEPTEGKLPVETVTICESPVRLPAEVTVTRRCP